jgi:hypothetical protein
MAYTIMINEAQRDRIEIALAALDVVAPPVEGDDDAGFLTEMFKDLPKYEHEDPKTLHGFCL